jgi:PQQ-like domain
VSRSLGLTAALLVCASSAADGSTSTWAARPAPDLYALTAANQLVGATASGRVVVRRQLAPARRATSPSPRLALDGGRLFVLVRRDTTPDRLVVLDAVTARVIVWRRLPQEFHARVLVAREGRVFIAGNRRVRRVAPGLFEEDAVVLEADRVGRVLRTFTVRIADGHDWWVTSAALSPDGRRLAVSYHGGCDERAPNLCTGGADVVDVTQGAREACVEPYRRSGCVEAHGHVEFYEDYLLAATGGEEIQVVGRAPLNTRLGNSHVMDFALDRTSRELVAAGPCQHLGGLSIVALDSGSTRVLVAPGQNLTPRLPERRVCGSRVALLPSLVAVAPISTAVAHPRGAGRVLLVDRRTGRVRARVSLRGEPVDVLTTH